MLPALPSEENWNVLAALLLSLNEVGGTMRNLQKTGALACQVLPCLEDMWGALQTIMLDGKLCGRMDGPQP